jgi:hypothetical protein
MTSVPTSNHNLVQVAFTEYSGVQDVVYSFEEPSHGYNIFEYVNFQAARMAYALAVC